MEEKNFPPVLLVLLHVSVDANTCNNGGDERYCNNNWDLAFLKKSKLLDIKSIGGWEDRAKISA